MKVRTIALLKGLLIAACIVGWFYWDLSHARTVGTSSVKSYFLESSQIACTATTASPDTIAIVRSDDSTLANAVSITANTITDTTIEQMVRRAVALAGGFSGVIHSGDTVLIKPNIVQQDSSGSGGVTDVRVVKAVVKMADEIDHGKIHILVGDGSARPYTTFEKATGTSKTAWTNLFDVPGYQTLKTEMVAAGIDFSLTNLNGNSATSPWDELEYTAVPCGGTAQPQSGYYYIHKNVLHANVYIAVPVMKIHEPGMTCALKDQIGLAAGSRYGFSKTSGVSQDSYAHYLHHFADAPYIWTDKEIVDLSSIAKIKFCIVDAIACLETQKTPSPSSYSSVNAITNRVRMNTIVAGKDPVAVDHVCARLMGLNPDDIEYITLAEREGLGTNDTSKMKIVGADLYKTSKRFKKNQESMGLYGQGNRVWLLNGTYDISSVASPMDSAFVSGESSLEPTASLNGWSAGTYFINDRANLGDYFGTTTSSKVLAYAFAYVYAPSAQKAELWVGSDESTKIWLNGDVVYNYSGTRTFAATSYYSDTAIVTLKQGYNRLLVKTLQTTGYFDFSINICEVESNSLYRGNRVWGLKFATSTSVSAVDAVRTTQASNSFELLNGYPNPFNNSIQIQYSIAKEQIVTLEIYNLLGQRIKTLIHGRLAPVSNAHTAWNGTDESGKVVASGMYLAVLRGEKSGVSVKKIVLLK